MTDLKKLTAEEFANRIGHHNWDIEQWIELVCRLERLEQCEAAAKEIHYQYSRWRDGYVTSLGPALVRLFEILPEAARAAVEDTK